jgi:hypothetical protein
MKLSKNPTPGKVIIHKSSSEQFLGNRLCDLGKEIVERRHGEPIKFLFLSKLGLLGSQAGNEKIAGCEL